MLPSLGLGCPGPLQGLYSLKIPPPSYLWCWKSCTHSRQLFRVNSQSGQCPGRLEARSEACSALSLKPKQDYIFNFLSNSLNINWLYVKLQVLFCREISVWFSFFWISCCFTPFNKFIHFSFVSWVNRTLIYILRCLLCANTHCFLLTPLSLNGLIFIM